MNTYKFYLSLLLVLVLGTGAQAQYFGRNKVNYETFDFKVQQTPHFQIYNYLDNEEYLREFSTWTEAWYRLHQRVLRDTFLQKNPLILYNDHADFQQTNAIFGQVGVGTGGVTEAFKNRVILPIATSNQQTHHVLGHELVHAFQYNMVIRGDSTNLNNIGNLPLWLVEGLAEYMSIGSVDALTAMWMRDAVLHDDVPSLRDLSNSNKYFPYRYGQAFWAYLTGVYGDDVIEPFYTNTAKYGFEEATIRTLGVTEKELSQHWQETVKSHFGAFLGSRKEQFVGSKLISEENGGRMNIAPELSPNGRYIIFLSERDLFGIDLFLADANTGKIIRKVASSTREGHIDDFDYIESAGTWSPDGTRFAYSVYSKGRNLLVIKDADSGKTVDEIKIETVQSFNNPSWSPDGNTIVFSGQVQGQGDLYAYNLKSKKIQRLTNDRYSELHPHWSEDGSTLLFATDQLSFERGRTNGQWTFNVAELDVASGDKKIYDFFFGADNLNPLYDTEGNILFLSNRDGFRNIYKFDPSTNKVYQMTDMLTGVSGITHYAPAMSIDRKRNRVVYMYFSKNRYSIYRAKMEDFLNQEVNATQVDFRAATMPLVQQNARKIVDAQLKALDQIEQNEDRLLTEYTEAAYRSKFRLDYVGGSTAVGVGTSNTFGTSTGVAGGVDLLFSDILGNNQLFSSLSLNGEIVDFGGAVSYINRRGRLMWGATLSHLPFRSFGFGNSGPVRDSFGNDLNAFADTFYIRRVFEQRGGLMAAYPFSTTLRLEGSASFSRYSSRLDQYVNVYQGARVGNQYLIGNFLGQDRQRVESEPGFNLWTVGAAFVGDNSFFGLTAPLEGHRFRFGADQYFGEFKFTAATADFRVYRFFRPIGLAARVMHYGRYGEDGSGLYPIYVGNPWYVRGFNSNAAESILIQNGQSFDQLVGSRVAVGNFEIRIPFTGPERLSLIKSGFFFTDLNFFVDAGVAWYNNDQLSDNIYELDTEGNRKPRIDIETGNPIVDAETGEPLYEISYPKALPIVSAGVSLRVNLFGALILEPYYARPFLENSKFVFGLNILPGW